MSNTGAHNVARRWEQSLALLALLTALPLPVFATEPASRVMIVGTYHLSNPGQDLHNVAAVDVLTPERQRELQAITDALATFEPTLVAVEWPEAIVDERYAQFLAGRLPESRNEVVQLGFRLARQLGLQRVHGLDVDGEFPFEPVQQWARANGRQAVLDALMANARREVETITQMQHSAGIAGTLRYLNEREAIRRNHSFYPALLTLGKGSEQPAAKLLGAWYERNFAICARLLQALKVGDRAIVFYGQGHAYLLDQCVKEAGTVARQDPLTYLPARLH